MDEETKRRITEIIRGYFEDGTITYRRAIEDLEDIGFDTLTAELMVSDWVEKGK